MQQEDEGGRNCGVEEWGFPREKIRRIETEQVSTRGELYEIITTIKINQGSIHEGGFSGHAQRWELGVQQGLDMNNFLHRRSDDKIRGQWLCGDNRCDE